MSVRFSILMPAYNREKYVGQAIDSILSQTFSDYELFLIDDGSTDKTVQIAESYGSRVKLLRQTNQGPEVARNKAAAVAQAEYLVLLDSDDLLLPCALATYDRIIRNFESPSLIIGAMTNFQDGQAIPADSSSALPVKVLKFRDYLSKDVSLGLSSSRISPSMRRPVDVKAHFRVLLSVSLFLFSQAAPCRHPSIRTLW